MDLVKDTYREVTENMISEREDGGKGCMWLTLIS